MTLQGSFSIGDWTVFPMEGRIQDGDVERRLQPKSMDVLVALAKANGQVVSRDSLLSDIWSGRAMTDEPLTRCIGELRKALNDSKAQPRYIQTIPKRGYRLMAEIIPSSEPKTPIEDQPANQRSTKNWTLAGCILMTVIVAALLFDRHKPESRFAPPKWSVAVLPFDDVSANSDHEFLADGVADQILELLAGVPGLRLTSRSSSFYFKNKPTQIPDIAQALNVAFVLEGSVRVSDTRVRITTNLVDAVADTPVWTESFDRPLKDIFDIQDEIAAAVSRNVRIAMQSESPSSRPTDPVAYALFLQARQLHQQPAGDGFQRAFEFYQGALAIDPQYLPAWVWLAALYDDTKNASAWPAQEAERRAAAAIESALAIDATDPMALGMRGVLRLSTKSRLEDAVDDFKSALAAEPGNPILQRWSLNALLALSQIDQAVLVAEGLYDRDPLGKITQINLATIYLIAGRFNSALTLCRQLETGSTIEGPCLAVVIQALAYSGQSGAAAAALEQAMGSRVHLRLSPLVWHSVGDVKAFSIAMDNLKRRFESGDTGLATSIARAYAFANDSDAAIRWLRIASEHGDSLIGPNVTYFRALENDPRYQAFLSEQGRSAEQLSRLSL
ncbi:MAG: winged helix-turn-helix domain-containing protein [Pseudomonadota bacterium]